jgi:hypothetical protein
LTAATREVQAAIILAGTPPSATPLILETLDDAP